MSCACSYPAEACYGDSLYFPAGTSARFRFFLALGTDVLTGGSVDFIAKASATTPDDSTATGAVLASWNSTADPASVVIMDALLGIVDVVFAPGDTTAGTDAVSPWFYFLRVNLAGGAVYIPLGASGALDLSAVTPCVGPSGRQVAYAPTARAAVVGPASAPLPAYATVAYVDTGDAATLAAAGVALALAFAGAATSNSVGDTTLSIPSTARHYTAVITFSGSTRTSNIVVPTTGRQAWDVVRVRIMNPDGAAITQNIRNATAAGTILYATSSDNGTGCFDLYYDGTAFQPLSYAQPVS